MITVIKMDDKYALITRPRGFGKTTAMTMLADFFGMEKDSGEALRQIKDLKYW